MPVHLRALLVDDEAPSRQQMRLLLAAHPEVTVIGEADGVSLASKEAARLAPDVIFLDVQMPGGTSGFDLLALLDPMPALVFVTAHDTFAVRAFEANAVDYLVKPVHPERLAATVRRLLEAPRQHEAQAAPAAEPGRLTLQDITMLRDGRKVRMMSVSKIVWIEAEGIYTRIGLAEGGYTRTLRSIGEWEQLLPERFFVRIERSLIVNLARIASVLTRSRNRSELKFHDPAIGLEIGRTASVKLRHALVLFGLKGR